MYNIIWRIELFKNGQFNIENNNRTVCYAYNGQEYFTRRVALLSKISQCDFIESFDNKKFDNDKKQWDTKSVVYYLKKHQHKC